MTSTADGFVRVAHPCPIPAVDAGGAPLGVGSIWACGTCARVWALTRVEWQRESGRVTRRDWQEVTG